MHCSRGLIVQTLFFSPSYLPRQLSPPETLVVNGGTTWARNGRWILPESARLPRNIQGSFTCGKSTAWDKWLYFPSEGRSAEDFFSPWKIRRLRPGSNPRTWVPKASTLPLDHRSRYWRCLWHLVWASCKLYMMLMGTKHRFAFQVQIHPWMFFVTVGELSALAFRFLFMLRASVGVQF